MKKWTVLIVSMFWIFSDVLASPEPDVDAARRMLDQVHQQIQTPAIQEQLEALKLKQQQISQIFSQPLNHQSGLNLDALPEMGAEELQRMQQDVAKLLQRQGSSPLMEQIESQRYTDGPLLLVSFAMPDSQLVALARDAGRSGTTLVLRGLVDNDLMATSRRIRQLLDASQTEHLTLMVDPTLFQRFAVQQVPTLVVSESISACDDTACVTPRYAKVAGSAQLGYLLDVIQREARDPAIMNKASQFLSRLQMSDLETQP